MKHFVKVDTHWVNAGQVCYVRSLADGGSAIGFHGGVWTREEDCWSNELQVSEPAWTVTAKLEAAMQGGGAE